MVSFYTSFYQEKGHLLLRGIENGKRIQEKVPLKPYLFVSLPDSSGDYITLEGKRVARIDFDSGNEAYSYLRKYGSVPNFKFYGMTNWAYPYINDRYPGLVEFDKSHIREGYIDIEVAADEGFPDVRLATKEITAITLLYNGKFYAFGCRPYVPHKDNILYFQCRDERELLEKFLQAWRKIDLDVVSGWNTEIFDIPYLINRIRGLMSPEDARRLSPWGKIYERTIEINNREFVVYDIVGVNSCDYLQIYKKFSFKVQESYKLNYVAHKVLGKKKIDYSQYKTLINLYRENFQLFMEYNIEDTGLVKEIDDKEGLLAQVYTIAYRGKVAFGDTLTTVRMWDVIIHNYLLSKNIVIPQFEPSRDEISIPGGFVKDPQLGLHKWIMSFDLTSLYPMLMWMYNISPETLRSRINIPFPPTYWTPDLAVKYVDLFLNGCVDQYHEHLDKENLSVTASSYTFTKDFQGFAAALMEELFGERDKYKKMMIEAKKVGNENDTARFHNMQLAIKILLNSCYGAMGNPYFRWFDPRLATSITLSGQLSIRFIEKQLNNFFNEMLGTDAVDYVIAVDTDSVYLSMDKWVSTFAQNMSHDEIIDFLDKEAEEKIEKYIDTCYGMLANDMHAYSQKMKMKREVIADKGIWTAKKRYILSVWDLEGVRYPNYELKIMGMETQRSSVPEVCRDHIKKVYEMVLHADEESVQKFLKEFRSEFVRMPFEDIAFPRGCNGLKKYYDGSVSTGLDGHHNVNLFKSKTPIHVRGAIQYNRYVKEKKLDNLYPPIQEGDKVKFIYLSQPNPLGDKVIAVPDILPRELGLERYIDFNTQYEKAFLNPVQTVLDVVGWSPVKKSTLRSLIVEED